MKGYFIKSLILILLFFVLNLEANNKKHILFLNSYHEGMPWSEGIKEGVYSVFDEEDLDYVFHIENMDTKRYSHDKYYKMLATLYKTKYRNTKFDLILSSDNNSLEFLKQYRNTVFGKVPVSFSGINNYDDSMIDGHNGYTGVAEFISYEENIELILKLHPNVKKIYFINDYLKTGRMVERNMRGIEHKYKDKIKIIYNKNNSLKDLKKEIENLKEDTIVLFGAYYADKNNEYITYEKVGEYILGESSVPVYCIAEFNITKNIIGGHVISSYSQGQLMAEIGKKILEGSDVGSLDVIKKDSNQYIFNAKGLERYKINRKLLPHNSHIVNDDITYLDQFKNMINFKYLSLIIFVFIVLIIFYKKTIFNEKGILNILVYGPIIFLPLVIGTLIYNLVLYNDKVYKNEINRLQIDYLKDQQNISYDKIEKTLKYINNIKSKMTLELEKNLKQRVDEAHTIANNIYTKNKKNKSKAEIQKMIVDALSKTRFFDGRGYYFINTNKAEGVLFKGVSKLGKLQNLYNLKDINGEYVLRKQIDVIRKKKAGFVRHYLGKIDSKNNNPSLKLTYVREFKPYDWHIGTGEYLDDFNETIKKEIFDYAEHIRYGNNGYLFAVNSKGIVLAHGDSTELVGKNMFNKVDANGVFYAQEIIKNAMANNLKFTKFGWFNKETQKIDTKYAIGTYIKEYDIIIGTGVFDNDVKKIIIRETLKLNKKNNEQIEQLLSISFIVLIIVLILSYVLSSMIKKIFQDYNHKLSDLNESLEKRIEAEIHISKEKDNLLFQQSKMASMGEMIGNIAHQWRQPLGVISVGATGLKMQKEHNLLSDKFFFETCDSINHNAQYLSKTIDDFKNFIKNDRDKVQFDLKENIESFLSLVESSIKNHEIKIILDLEENLTLNSYPNELTQCFMNLFNNSKDALKDIQTKRYLSISTKRKDSKVVISFKDNAGGIEDDVIKKIFEPYFTTKHKSQGTGLGLSMTYKIIVEGMNGTIDVHNIQYITDDKEFKGAEFIIKLDF